jgi:hypothetical protein
MSGDPERADHLFYLAVSFYEVGYRQAARQALERALPELPQSAYVLRRSREILGSPP